MSTEGMPELRERVAEVQRQVLAHPELAAVAAELDRLRQALASPAGRGSHAAVPSGTEGAIAYFLEYEL